MYVDLNWIVRRLLCLAVLSLFLQERQQLLAYPGAVLGGPHDGTPSCEAGSAAGAGVPENGQLSAHVHVHGREHPPPRGDCVCVRAYFVCASFF